MTEAPSKLWTKNFIFLSAMNFQLVLVFYLLVIVSVGYALAELNATTAQAGLISGVFVVGTLVGRLLIGKFLPNLGAKASLVAGALGFFLFSGLYFIPVDVPYLIAIRFAHGFMMGVAGTVIGTVIAQTIPATRRAEGIGYFSTSSTLATAVGPFLAIWLMSQYDYKVIFTFTSIVAFTCLLFSFGVDTSKVKLTAKAGTQQSTQPTSRLAQFVEPKAFPIAVIILIAGACYSGVLSFLNLYAKEIDLLQAASFFFLMYAAAILISRPFTGPLMDRKGENIIMYPAIVLMAIGIGLLSQAHNSWMLLTSAALLGFGYGNIQSICQTIAVKSTTIERMGLATSTFFIALDAALGFGPYFIGQFLDQIGYQHLYLYSAVITLSCLLWYYLLHGRKVKAVAT